MAVHAVVEVPAAEPVGCVDVVASESNPHEDRFITVTKTKNW